MDFRLIFNITGYLISILAATMTIPAIVDLSTGSNGWHSFLISAVITLFIGVMLILTNRNDENKTIDVRQAFLLTPLSWLAVCLFGSLPFCLGYDTSFTDAFFEATSGLTTTGSTIFTDLDNMNKGILLWRAMLQWMGGLGIIVMAVSLLPMLQIGGMQMFKVDFAETAEKVIPRAAQLSTLLAIILFMLTLFCAIGYRISGMTAFEAICDAMSTISTGGYATTDSSMSNYSSAALWNGSIFMILGSLPYLLYLRFIRGDWKCIHRDQQVFWFLTILFAIISLMVIYLSTSPAAPAQDSLFDTITHASFNVISILTGTGYSSTDYTLWGPFAAGVFFFIMFIGGCAGSTSCGIKIFRLQILYIAARNQIYKTIHPHAVVTNYYNGNTLSEEVRMSVMSFFFVYIMTYAILSIALCALGVDVITALSATGTTISNVGPGLGDIVGPSGNFAPLGDAAKWVLVAAMLLGRLELFTFFVLIVPSFWKK